MGLIARALGVDYFSIVQSIQVLAPLWLCIWLSLGISCVQICRKSLASNKEDASCIISKASCSAGVSFRLNDVCFAPMQNAPIAKRWEGLFAYLVLGYAAAFMTRGATVADSALLGARIGFVIYAVCF